MKFLPPSDLESVLFFGDDMNQASIVNWLVSNLGSGAVFAIIIYAFKKHFFQSYLQEKGKNLATNEDISTLTELVESVKSNHTKALQRDSKIHERQLDKLSLMFQTLSVVQSDAQNLMRTVGFEGENRDAYPEKLFKSINDAGETFLSCQLYINDDLIALIHEFFDKVQLSRINFAMATHPSVTDGNQRAEYWQNAGVIAFADLPKILAKIRQQARAIIDVYQPAQPAYGAAQCR